MVFVTEAASEAALEAAVVAAVDQVTGGLYNDYCTDVQDAEADQK
jgi:hypothetical protein